MKYVLSLSCIVALLLILTGCDVGASSASSFGNGGYFSGNGLDSSMKLTTQLKNSDNTSLVSQGPNPGNRTKTSGCQVRGPLQDSACTPGAIFPNVTKEQICQSSYASSVRNVPPGVVNQVYAEYGINSHAPGQYEVDHLITLGLGGSNDIANLWPEAASPRPGFHEKDQVETYLHNRVCSGAVSLQQAQIQIATNWLNVYNQMSSGMY